MKHYIGRICKLIVGTCLCRVMFMAFTPKVGCIKFISKNIYTNGKHGTVYSYLMT